jgi:hypothetical protein
MMKEIKIRNGDTETAERKKQSAKGNKSRKDTNERNIQTNKQTNKQTTMTDCERE